MLPHQAIVSVTWQESYLERKKKTLNHSDWSLFCGIQI